MADETGSGSRSLAIILSQINRGEFLAECSQALHELAIACERRAEVASSGKGTITIKLAITVDHMGVTTIMPDVTVKKPNPLRGGAVFWLDKASNLTNKDTRQQELPLHDVKMPNAQIRDLANNAETRTV